MIRSRCMLTSGAHVSSSCAFSRKATDRAVQKYGERGSACEKHAGAEEPGSVGGSADEQAGRHEPQKFAVFDIDGTLVRWQLYHAITHELGKLGYLPEGSLEHMHESRMVWKNRNSQDSYKHYEAAIVDTFQGALANIPVDSYNSVVDTVFSTYKDQVYTYTRDLIKQLKNDGYLLFAISGSPQEILEKIGKHYGFDEVVGTKYEQHGSTFTGQVSLVHTRKGEVMQELIEKHGLSRQGSVAIGDSPSDVAMLELVEKPIAFNPTKDLYELALTKSWPIVVERKNVIYRLEPENGIYTVRHGSHD